MTTRKRRGRGEGAIFQRKDGTWCASISLGHDANGKRQRRIVYCKNKAAVQEKLRGLQTAADLGTLPDVKSLTVGQLNSDNYISPSATIRIPQRTSVHVVSCQP